MNFAHTNESYSNWTGDTTTTSNTLPLCLKGYVLHGTFSSVSTLARMLEIDVGTKYYIYFYHSTFALKFDTITILGHYEWQLGATPNERSGITENTTTSSLFLYPERSALIISGVVTARDVNFGSFQSQLGIASCNFLPTIGNNL